MNVGKLNDWLQLAAGIGVLAGLLLVAYELRQERELVRAQLGSDTISGFQDVMQALREDETAGVYEKMLVDPASLTLREQLVLDSLLSEIIYAYATRPNYLVVRGVFEDRPDRFAFLASELILTSAYGRQWWSENRRRFGPGANLAMDDIAFGIDQRQYRDSAARILERTLQERPE